MTDRTNDWQAVSLELELRLIEAESQHAQLQRVIDRLTREHAVTEEHWLCAEATVDMLEAQLDSPKASV